MTIERDPKPKLAIVPPPSPPPVHVERAAAIASMSFNGARHFRRGQRRSPAIWVVLHATHGGEGLRKAEDAGHMFATLPLAGPKKSAHCCVDTDSVVQCVPWECEAYHGGPTANQFGEGVELCGSADQTLAQWLDALSLPMLSIAANIVRWRCSELRIPMVFRTATDLRSHVAGVTTHREISRAFPQDTTHYDPGPHFPIDAFMAAVAR
jgi:hypothetical protein